MRDGKVKTQVEVIEMAYNTQSQNMWNTVKKSVESGTEMTSSIALGPVLGSLMQHPIEWVSGGISLAIKWWIIKLTTYTIYCQD
jgi:hypothetical protein